MILKDYIKIAIHVIDRKVAGTIFDGICNDDIEQTVPD